MLLGIHVFLFVALVSFVSTLDVSHQDLEDPDGKICSDGGSCTFKNTSKKAFPDRNCMCDEACSKYGDCCKSSEYYNENEQRTAIREFECAYAESKGYIYRRVKCPSTWRNKEVHNKCEKSTGSDYEDPLLVTPVTNLRSKTTYGNIFCAICNSDTNPTWDLVYWEQGLNCTDSSGSLLLQGDLNNKKNNLTYNHLSKQWQIQTYYSTYRCNLGAIISDRAKNAVRGCIPNTKQTCPSYWEKDDIRQHCESYTLVVYMQTSEINEVYRNVHCGICNNAPVQELQCVRGPEIDPKLSINDISPFSILLEFTSKTQPCKIRQVYDVFYNKCRDVFEPYHSDDTNYDMRILPRNIENCSRIFLHRSEYTMNHDSVNVSQYNHVFKSGEYKLRDDGVEICSEGFTTLYVSKFRTYLSILSVIGIGLSIICIVLHLLVFCVVKELRNLSGKNLASMCVALLVAYCSFVASSWLEGRACFINAIVTYYFFLAAFTWTLVMAFDVWRTLRIATKELRVNSGKQWRKFFIYSICGWILPAMIVLVAVVTDLCSSNFVPRRFRPHFGNKHCWFGQGSAILLFFGLPLFLILICNVVFFSSSAYMVYSSSSMAKYSASSNTKRDFKFYTRLALIMGLTWIVGVIAGFADIEILWVLFILLNTTLGLFVFAAFTCRSKVLHTLKNFKRDKMPAFNWSMNNSDDSKMSNGIEKQTSSTYY